MDALRLSLLAALLAVAAPAEAQDVALWRTHIAEASARFGVPQDWIERVMRAESGGRTMLGGRSITSSAGAMGLMQLMPGTWLEMRRAHGLGPDPHDPRDNILAGTAYLRVLHDRFGYPGLFGASNAGPRRYSEHVSAGRTLPRETRRYLAMVVPGSGKEAVPSGIFIALRNGTPTAATPGPIGGPAILFFPLGGVSPGER